MPPNVDLGRLCVVSDTVGGGRVSVDSDKRGAIQWLDIRFEDGEHAGVRVLRGTTIIEVQRKGRKLLIDIATCLPIDLERINVVR